MRPLVATAALLVLGLGAPALAGAATRSVATTPTNATVIHMTAPTTTTIPSSATTKACKTALRHYGVTVSAWNRQRNAILSAYVTARKNARNNLTTALAAATTKVQINSAHAAFAQAALAARTSRDAALTALGKMPKRPDC
ncbi:MAG TPA: hypothetical protein VGS61_08355 [Acidimicrobiales bacterium]|nr:hypothetical protein [Acidimicrobiales bacterium]